MEEGAEEIENKKRFIMQKPAYRWFRIGDINAFFGLMGDNMSDLVIMAGLLVGVFQFPADIVLYKTV